MKKSHKFDELSKIKCSISRCNKKIKQRLVDTKYPKNTNLCFEHHKEKEAKRGHMIKAIPYSHFKKFAK